MSKASLSAATTDLNIPLNKQIEVLKIHYNQTNTWSMGSMHYQWHSIWMPYFLLLVPSFAQTKTPSWFSLTPRTWSLPEVQDCLHLLELVHCLYWEPLQPFDYEGLKKLGNLFLTIVYLPDVPISEWFLQCYSSTSYWLSYHQTVWLWSLHPQLQPLLAVEMVVKFFLLCGL